MAGGKGTEEGEGFMSEASAFRGGPAVYGEEAIRAAVSHRAALDSAERAFRSLARDECVSPMPMGVEIPEVHGEVHVKGAHLQGSPIFAFKVATGFYGNVEMGVPTGSGLVLVFSAETGFPLGVLADNGYLTDLRTAAAGALAARHLTPGRPLVLAIIGAGVQGRMQAELIHKVRDLKEIRVWSRKESSRKRYVSEVSRSTGIPVYEFPEVAAAVKGADLVVTATPSHTPLIHPGMLKAGATVIAVGADGPDKREIAVDALLAADKLVCDLTTQSIRIGELHHAVKTGKLSLHGVYAELGHIVVGDIAGRVEDETIICDLTGVGAQDAAIAEAAWKQLSKRK
jgi:ornithine cyclodeaminase